MEGERESKETMRQDPRLPIPNQLDEGNERNFMLQIHLFEYSYRVSRLGSTGHFQLKGSKGKEQGVDDFCFTPLIRVPKYRQL